MLPQAGIGHFCGTVGRICGKQSFPCAEAPLKDRRLGEHASPEGLIASFRTRVVAEPVLQDPANTTLGRQILRRDGTVELRCDPCAESLP